MKLLVVPIVLGALGSVPKSIQHQLELLNIHYAGLIPTEITEEYSVEFLIFPQVMNVNIAWS